MEQSPIFSIKITLFKSKKLVKKNYFFKKKIEEKKNLKIDR